jgi:transposase
MMAEEKRVKREHAGPEVWRERVERWKQSGLTCKEFAAKEDLSSRSLSWWQWRLQRSAAGPAERRKQRRRVRRKRAPNELSFVPVVVGNAMPPEAPSIIEIVLPSNLRLRVPAGIDETSLVRIVRALGAA